MGQNHQNPAGDRCPTGGGQHVVTNTFLFGELTSLSRWATSFPLKPGDRLLLSACGDRWRPPGGAVRARSSGEARVVARAHARV